MAITITKKDDKTLPSGRTVADHIADMGLGYRTGRAVELIFEATHVKPDDAISALEDAIILLGKEKLGMQSARAAASAKPVVRRPRKPKDPTQAATPPKAVAKPSGKAPEQPSAPQEVAPDQTQPEPAEAA